MGNHFDESMLSCQLVPRLKPIGGLPQLSPYEHADKLLFENFINFGYQLITYEICSQMESSGSIISLSIVLMIVGYSIIQMALLQCYDYKSYGNICIQQFGYTTTRIRHAIFTTICDSVT